MHEVERLISELQQGGRVDSHGEFTLDREAAREKMRKYQLATPQAYLMELVQAAVLRGATRIELEIDADDTRLVCDGEPFTSDDFAELYTSMFAADPGAASPEESRQLRSRQQLALGLNGALGLEPRWVRLYSAATGSATALSVELRPDRPDTITEVPSAGAGTRIHVKKRPHPKLLLELVRNLGSGTSEERVLEERCRYCQVPVILEGRQVSHGLQLPGMTETVEISEPDLRGVAGLDLSPGAMVVTKVVAGSGVGASVLHILTNGVLVTSERLDLGQPPLAIVVDGSGLKKNVAQTGIVKDAAYDRLHTAVLAARERAMTGLCRRLLECTSEQLLPVPADTVRLFLRREIMQFTEPAALTGSHDQYPGILAQVPLYPTLAESGALLSLQDGLALCKEHGHLPYCTRRFTHFQLSGKLERIALLQDKAEREHLQSLLGVTLKDVTGRFVNQIKREQNRRLWLSREHAANLGSGHYLARLAIRGKAVRGEIGIAELDGKHRRATSFRFIKDGHLLHRREVHLPIPACEVVLEAAFSNTKSYDGVKKNATLADALLEMARVLPDLFAQVAAGYVQRSLFRRRISDGALLDGIDQALQALSSDYPFVLLTAYGFTESSSRRHVERYKKKHSFEFSRPDIGSRSSLLMVPVYLTAAQDRVCLADIYRHLERRGSVGYIRWDVPDSKTAGKAGSGLVLRLHDSQRQCLQQLLGTDGLRDITEEYLRDANRAVHLSKPKEQPRIARHYLCVQPLQGAGISGEIGFLDPTVSDWEGADSPGPQQLRLRLLKGSRFLAERTLPVPLGPLWGVVDCDDLVPTTDWDDVEEGAPLELIRQVVIAAIPGLVDQLGELLPRLEGSEVQAPSQAMLAALDRLSGQADSDPTLPRISHQLSTAAGDAPPPASFSRLGVLDVLSSTPAHPSGRKQHCAQHLAGLATKPGEKCGLLEHLLRLPLLPLLGAASTSVGALQEMAADRSFLDYVPPQLAAGRVSPFPADRPVLVCDEQRLALLRRLLGKDRLKDCSAELTQAWRLEKLTARPQLASITLAASEVLLAVPLADDGIEGEVGLARHMPAGRPRSVLRLCRLRRLLASEWVASDLGLAAIIDDTELPLAEGDIVAVAEEAVSRACALVATQVPVLLRRLAAVWPNLPEAERSVAWWHVLTALAAAWRHEVGLAVAGDEQGHRFAAKLDATTLHLLTGLAGFHGADSRRYSIHDIERSFSKSSEVLITRSTPPVGAVLPDQPLLVVSPWEARYLGRLFGKLSDCSELWQQQSSPRSMVQATTDTAEQALQRPPRTVTEPRQTAAAGLSVVPREIDPASWSWQAEQWPPDTATSEVSVDDDEQEQSVVLPDLPVEPSPEQRLIAAVRAELQLPEQEGAEAELQSLQELDRLHLGSGTPSLIASSTAQGPRLHRSNPLVEAALTTDDPILVHYLSAALLTAMNISRADITEENERTFLLNLVTQIDT